jgi:hypothetical protein
MREALWYGPHLGRIVGGSPRNGLGMRPTTQERISLFGVLAEGPNLSMDINSLLLRVELLFILFCLP